MLYMAGLIMHHYIKLSMTIEDSSQLNQPQQVAITERSA